jgi:hypothetical protein
VHMRMPHSPSQDTDPSPQEPNQEATPYPVCPSNMLPPHHPLCQKQTPSSSMAPSCEHDASPDPNRIPSCPQVHQHRISPHPIPAWHCPAQDPSLLKDTVQTYFHSTGSCCTVPSTYPQPTSSTHSCQGQGKPVTTQLPPAHRMPLPLGAPVQDRPSPILGAPNHLLLHSCSYKCI